MAIKHVALRGRREMTALVTREDIEGVLLRPLSNLRISTLSSYLQQATETWRVLLDVKMQGEANRHVV